MVQENAEPDSQITSVKLCGNKNPSSLRRNDFLAVNNNENL